MSAAFARLVLALAVGSTPTPKADPPTIQIEARFLTVPAGASDGLPADGKPVTLTDAELGRLFEALQGNRAVNVLAAPKVTTAAGKPATLSVGEQAVYTTGVEAVIKDGKPVAVPKVTSAFVGLRAKFVPTLEGDGTTVRLAADVSHTTAAAATPVVPVTYMVTPVFEGGSQGQPVPVNQFLQVPTLDTKSVNTVVDLPAGRTVVVPLGTRAVETRTEFGPPLLSKIPYLNRMFKNVGVGRESRNVYLTLTARVVE